LLCSVLLQSDAYLQPQCYPWGCSCLAIMLLHWFGVVHFVHRFTKSVFECSAEGNYSANADLSLLHGVIRFSAEFCRSNEQTGAQAIKVRFGSRHSYQ